MTGKAKVGRPTDYKEEYNSQAFKLCLLGATDKSLADFFSVEEKTINNWKKSHPEFLQSIREGKDEADAKVADSLYNRALGYSHKDDHISNYQGDITVTPTTKHYPPDATSAIFWLKNRQKENWRDKQDVEHSGKIEIESLTDEQIAARIKALQSG